MLSATRDRVPFDLALPLGRDPTAAVASLQRALHERPTIEIEPMAASDRRVVGTLDGRRVDLAVHDDRLWSSRKGWRVEFHGAIEGSTSIAVLRGTVDIPEHRPLRAVLGLFALAGLSVVVIAVALALRDASAGAAIDLGPLLFAALIAAGTHFASVRVAADIERAAAEDGRLLAAFLEKTLQEAWALT